MGLDRAQPIINRQEQIELAKSIFHDINELKQAEMNQRLLAGAGELLARDLDTAALMQGLAQLPVPALADYCVIYHLDADGEIRATAAAHANPQELPSLQLLVNYRDPNPSPDAPVRQALLRQEPVLLAQFDRAVARQNMPEHLRHLAHLLPHSLVLAPLVARERLSGVLLLARQTSPEAYTTADLALVQELARRAALALDNSDLYAESRRLNLELEDRVRQATAELRAALEQLQQNYLELQAEIRARQAAEDRFRGLLQAAPDATVIADAKGQIAIVNQQAEALFGYAAHELIGQKVELLLPRGLTARHRAHRRAYLKAPRTRAMGHELELRARRRDGHEFPVEVSLSPLQTPEGWLIMASVRDITQRKQIEAELRTSREQLRQLSGHLQAAREEERTRMSREIHDELGGALTGLKMDVARLAKSGQTLTAAELGERTQSMAELIDSTVQVVRRMASDLRPGILDDFGLAAAIEWQLQEYCGRAGLEFEYRAADSDLNLDPASSTALFRLFQETLTNVARHAQATRVHVRLEQQPDELVLEIRDNGRGITVAEIANAQSLGLLGMRERVLLLNGQLNITGVPGQGTTVLIQVPVAPSTFPPAAAATAHGE